MRDINAKLVTILGDQHDLEFKVNDDSNTSTKGQVRALLASIGATGALVEEDGVHVYIPPHQIMRIELDQDR